MLKATYKKHILQFKQASGTSRGVMTEKETWFIILEENGEKGMSLIENEIIQKGRATDLDYGLQGDFYLMTKQYIKAEVAIKKAISMNATNIEHQLRLAHVYLFSNRISDAKDIHKKYRSNNVSSSKSWAEATKEDFENFKKNGLPTDDFKKILRILE